ncbi:hypothetical protein HPB52_009329 [Rhipicephalus sanguineus]|uniref:Uncharacterized protein n=1 Tax=Rhipicephalus sanguineus TaxID=34632 RepID=A0A9D4QD27_RHISA|nr:hypothetical protein HPB52_009329 [Rhipicephalus sanguineus]
MNKLLLGSMSELRECPGASGQLHLEHNTDSRPTIQNFDRLHLPQYPEFLGWLLKTHRCISSAHILPLLDNYTGRAILEALRHNSGIKTLCLGLYEACQHFSSVSISIHRGNVAVSLAFAEFLESTTALRKLHLDAGLGAQVEADGDTRWWSLVLKALPRNNSLRELSVTLCSMSAEEKAELADSPTTDASAFVRRFAKDIEQNHILLTLICDGHIHADVAGHWHTVQETTRRNSGVVARAARLQKASLLDRYVSGALQRVMPHPALLAEVAELVKIEKAELVNLIRDRLKGAETLDGFMKMTGVVKERVICHASDDGSTQLDALNEDCWRHVFQYLFIDDVKEGIGPNGRH